MTSFEESVQDIEGLTAFKLGTAPAWFSQRLRSKSTAAMKDDFSDAELIAREHEGWLGQWGTATIKGEEVFLFLFRTGLGFYAFEPAMLADGLDCGWRQVEASDRYDMWDTTMFFTEHGQRVLHRRTTDGVLATI